MKKILTIFFLAVIILPGCTTTSASIAEPIKEPVVQEPTKLLGANDKVKDKIKVKDNKEYYVETTETDRPKEYYIDKLWSVNYQIDLLQVEKTKYENILKNFK